MEAQMGLLKRLTGSLSRVAANPIVHLAVLISIVVASLALPATAASPESERDVRIVASKDVAFIHCLQRTSGTLKGGLKDEMWVRITSGLRKINGKWLIVHDHVSVPVDFVTGKAVFDLKPGGEPQAR